MENKLVLIFFIILILFLFLQIFILLRKNENLEIQTDKKIKQLNNEVFLLTRNKDLIIKWEENSHYLKQNLLNKNSITPKLLVDNIIQFILNENNNRSSYYRNNHIDFSTDYNFQKILFIINDLNVFSEEKDLIILDFSEFYFDDYELTFDELTLPLNIDLIMEKSFYMIKTAHRM